MSDSRTFKGKFEVETPIMTNPDTLAGGVKLEAGIYVASKVKHATMWKDMRTDRFPIISTWIDEAYPEDMAGLWERCVREASSAAALLLYREPDEVLKGAWVELGAALANGVPVFAVGIHEFTIANDKRIRHFASLSEARVAITALLAALPAAGATEPGEPRMPHSGMTASEAAAFIDEQAALAASPPPPSGGEPEPVAWTDKNGLEFLARGYGIDVSAEAGTTGRTIPLFASPPKPSEAMMVTDEIAAYVLKARPFGDATIGKYLGLQETSFHSIAIIKRILTAALSGGGL